MCCDRSREEPGIETTALTQGMNVNIRANRAKRLNAASAPSVQAVPPPPASTRPRSYKWVVILASVLSIGLWWGWDHFLRTSAYAVVEVDQIQVCAPLTGLIESMRVMEDSDYEAGTVAFSLVDRDARNELETLQLQLRLIESRLAERATSLKLSRADRLYERDELIARRRAELGGARMEEARLAAEIARLSAELPSTEFDLRRLERLAKQDAASEQELLNARTEHNAAASGLSRLLDAQAAAKARIDAIDRAIERPVPVAPEVALAVDPLRREAELVRKQIEQMHEQLGQSEVSLPSSGRVARILRHPGEFVRAGEPVLIVTRPSTLRVVAYFEQTDTSKLRANQEVSINSSYGPQATGRITRLGPALKMVPEAISRFHPASTPLLPVEIEIDAVGRRYLVPGSVVRIYPHSPFSTVQSAQANEWEHDKHNAN